MALQAIVEEAIELDASDIDFTPSREQMRCRMRILGRLTSSTRSAVVSRSVVEPLIGARSIELGGVSWRVASVPVLGGVHVRLRRTLARDLMELGLDDPERLRAQLDRPGLIAIAGPIGSGRTTTFYAALASLDLATRTVITIEDAIERPIDGVLQMRAPTRPDDPHAFAHVVCDQSPDVVGVGHLSDAFMTLLAVSCGQAGASVLATVDALHASAVPMKLMCLGIDPYEVVSSLRFVIAQRLVRVSCTACLDLDPDGALKLADLGHTGAVPRAGAGCPQCDHTGFAGRIALFEVLPITQPIRDLVLQGGSAVEIREQAVGAGMIDLTRRALDALRDGRCCVDEVLPILAS